MPEKANVFLGAETEVQQDYRQIIERAGHKVILTATSKAEALREIPTFREKGVQVAVLDSFGITDDIYSQRQDIQTVIDVIREHAPEVPIIATMGGKLLRLRDTDLFFTFPDRNDFLSIGQDINKV